MKKLLTFLSIAMILSSCYSTKVLVDTRNDQPIAVDTLFLVSTMIGPVEQPVFPLLDAAAFNSKTNDLADQILVEEQKIVEKYETLLIESLNARLPVVVKAGEDITSALANQYRINIGIQINDKDFPVVFFSEGDINILDFDKKMDMSYIFNNVGLKRRIAKIASDLNLENVLVCYNRLCVVNVGSFGFLGDLRLESYLYLYDSDGELLMTANGRTMPTTIDGNQINQYKFQLDNFRALAHLMSSELVNHIQ
jgi:hypothetical protein